MGELAVIDFQPHITTNMTGDLKKTNRKKIKMEALVGLFLIKKSTTKRYPNFFPLSDFFSVLTLEGFC